MFETLFGADVPVAVKFFLSFVLVLAVIGLIAWLVRRFGSERFGGSSARGRQPRLAVVDAAAVDLRRRLIIIRRDNVEHLLMIGGPTDVVVEQNIVRAMGAPRDKTAEPAVVRGPSISETVARPAPLAEGSMWPLQPQPEINGRPPRAAAQEPEQWMWPAQSEPQRPAPRAEPRVEKPASLPNMADDLSTRHAPMREPTLTWPAMPSPISRPTPTPTPAAASVEDVEKIEKPPAVAEPDQDLAEISTRLEASLRRELRVAPEAPAKAEPAPPPSQRVTPREPKAVGTETKLAESKPKAVFESLEEEMASLLGRPPGKS